MTNIGRRIFISRNQTVDSVFYKTLTEKGFIVHGESLIEITPVPFDNLPEVDWIFFYSKNGVRYFFEQLKGERLFKCKFATIGPGTADYLLSSAAHGLNRGLLDRGLLNRGLPHPHFIGDGNAETTAEAFLPKIKKGKVLFPRAKNSQRSVQLFLENKVECLDLIVYENVQKKAFNFPEIEFDALVFTSPLNAKAYFSQKKINEQQMVVAIGKTTATALNKLGVNKVIISENPSEESLAKTILAVNFFS